MEAIACTHLRCLFVGPNQRLHVQLPQRIQAVPAHANQIRTSWDLEGPKQQSKGSSQHAAQIGHKRVPQQHDRVRQCLRSIRTCSPADSRAWPWGCCCGSRGETRTASGPSDLQRRIAVHCQVVHAQRSQRPASPSDARQSPQPSIQHPCLQPSPLHKATHPWAAQAPAVLPPTPGRSTAGTGGRR